MISETLPAPLSGSEGAAIALAGIAVTDSLNPGDPTLKTVLQVSDGTITVGTPGGATVLNNGSGTVTLEGTAAAINAALASSNYTGNSGFYGTDQLAATTTDGGGNSSGTQKVAITVADTAVISETLPAPLSGSESAAIALAGIAVTDSLNPGDPTLKTVLQVSDGTITVGTPGGATVLNNGSGTVTLEGTAAAINAALASSNYTGNSGFYGTDQLAATTTDGGGNSSGTQKVAITVADTAVISETLPALLSGSESAAIALAGIAVTDSLNPGDPTLKTVLQVSDGTITVGTPGGATVLNNGSGTVTLEGTAAAINAALASSNYTGNSGFYGTDQLAATTTDGGGNSSGTQKVAITVADTAVISETLPAPLSGSESAAIALAGIAVTDSLNPGDPTLKTVLQVSDGTITVGTPGGATVLNNGSGTVTLEGTAAAINAALASSNYTGNSGFYGTDQLAATTTDGGGNSSGTQKVAITVAGTAVISETLPALLSGSESAAIALAGIAVTDSLNPGDPTLKTVLQVSDGTITVGTPGGATVLNNGSGTVTLEGTAAAINAALASSNYTGNSGFYGTDQLAATTTDGGGNSSGTQKVAITVADTAVISETLPAPLSGSESAAIALAGIAVTDSLNPGDPTLKTVLQVSDGTITVGTPGGATVLNNGSGTVTLEGTAAAINAALASSNYTGNSGFYGTDQLAATTTDGGGNSSGTQKVAITVADTAVISETLPALLSGSESAAIALAGIAVTDSLNPGDPTLKTVLQVSDGTITVGTPGGATVLNNGSGTVTLEGTAAAINAALASSNYTGNSGFYGTDQLAATTTDGGGNSSGTQKVAITVADTAVISETLPAPLSGSESAAIALAGIAVTDSLNPGDPTLKTVLQVSDGTITVGTPGGATVLNNGSGTVTLEGTAAAINAALASSNYTGNSGFYGTDQLAATTTDGGGNSSGTQKVAITVADTAVISETLPAPLSGSESAAIALAGIAVTDSLNPGDPTLKTVLQVSDGTITVGTPGGATVLNNGSGTVTLEGTAAAINAALASSNYTGNSGFYGTDQLAATTTDGGGNSSGTQKVAITVADTAVISETLPAPLSGSESAAISLAGIAVTDSLNPGDPTLKTVLQVSDGTITVGTPGGATVLNNGSGTVTLEGTAAAINAALASSNYTGNSGFYGTDQLAATTTDGGGNSSGTQKVAITVADTAVISETLPAPLSGSESAAISLAGIAVTDSLNPGDPTLKTVLQVSDGTITVGTPGGATVLNNGSGTVTLEGTATAINAALASSNYTGNSGFYGTDQLAATTTDGGGNSSGTQKVAITVADTAVISETLPAPLSGSESAAISLAGIAVTDSLNPGDPTLKTVLQVSDGTITVGTPGGATVLNNGSGTVTLEGTATAINAALASSNYTGNSGFYGTDQLAATTTDGGGNSSGTQKVAITVADTAVISETLPAPLSGSESAAISLAGIAVTDSLNPGDPTLKTVLQVSDGTITVGTPGGATVLNNGSGTVTLEGTATAINAALASSNYTGNSGFYGTDQLAATTTDGGGNSSGTQKVAITVADTAVISETLPAPLSGSESAAISLAGIAVTDSLNPGDPTLKTVLQVSDGTITVGTPGGATVLNNGSGTVTLEGTATAINAALASSNYTGNSGFYGTDQLAATTTDGGGNSSGTQKVAITVADTAVISETLPAPLSGSESAAISLAGIAVTDSLNPGDPTLKTVLQVSDGTITVGTPGGATVLNNGSGTVTLEGTATAINAALASSNYTGNSGFYGTDQLAATTTDGGGNSSGTQKVAITVADTAVISETLPAPLSGSESAAISLAGIAVTDSLNPGDPTLKTVLQVSDGTITVGTPGGATVLNNGSGTVTLEGTAAAINAALASSNYTGNSGFYGTDQLAATTTDGGGNSSGTQKVAITVADTAVISETLPAPLSGSESAAISLAGIAVTDSLNPGDPTLKTVLQVSDGTITVGTPGGATVLNNGSGTVTLEGTATAINAALASSNYTGNSGFYGTDQLAATTTDGGGNSSGTQKVAITVADTAVISETLPAPLSGSESAAISLAGIAVTDSLNPGDPTLKTVLQVSDGTITVGTPGGATVLNNGSGTVTLEGTATAINAALASSNYTGNSGFYGTDQLAATTTDGGGNSSGTQKVAITVASGTEYWVTTSSADWATVSASDWNFVSPPTSANPTVIDASGTYTVTISSADVAQSLTINDSGATVMDENGGSLTLGGALTVDAGVFEFAGGTLAGVSALTIGTSGVIDAANPNLASVIDTGNPVINDGALEASGGGDLVIRDPLDNDGGVISIQDGNVELAVSNSLTVNFSGTGGTLQLDNTVTGGVSAGVDATSTGTAAIVITNIGSVSSTGAAGIEATSAGGNISITPEGSVAGTIGVDATQHGNGNITITVGGAAGTTITGTAYYGILGLSLGSDDVSVSTTSADTIESNSSGIVAESQAATIAANAGSSITVTAQGTIDSGSQLSQLGYAPDGIVAGYLPNADGEPDANVNGSVTVNNFANITAAAGSSGGAGIDAFNFGNGDVTVNDNYGAGAVASTSVSGAQYGIEAITDSGGTGNVTVNIGTDATLSSSTGSSGLFGVDAFSTDTGNITVMMSTGDSVTSGSAGIVAVSWATTDPATSTIALTAAGTINSGANAQDGGNPPAGILAGYYPNNAGTANSSVQGNVNVTSDASINAAGGLGIDAINFGTGNVTVTTNVEFFDHRLGYRDRHP